jgi:heavy metal translocating P-type ATPase
MLLELGVLSGIYVGMRGFEQYQKLRFFKKIFSEKLLLISERDDARSIAPSKKSFFQHLVPYNPSQINQHYFKASSFALGLAVVSILIPSLLPVGIALTMYAAFPILKGAEKSLRQLKIDNDVLISLFTVLGLAAKNNALMALSTWIYMLASIILENNKNRSKAIFSEVFQQHVQEKVWVFKNQSEVEVLLENLKSGDIVIVSTGEHVPVDGIIVDGMATIDQHWLMGESQPVEKMVGDEVFAATLVITGKIFVQVDKTGQETTIAKIANILEHTIDYQSSLQQKGEKWADKIAPPILALAALVFPAYGLSGSLIVINSSFGNRIRFLVPLSTLNHLKIAFHQGILIKDGRAIELLKEVDTLLFDKTGTLTHDQLQVGRIIACHTYCETEIVSYAAAAECKIKHPIAQAILDKAAELQLSLPQINESHYQLGYGITLKLQEKIIKVGSINFMEKEGIEQPTIINQAIEESHAQGHSVILVAIDQQLIGLLELKPTIRPEIKQLMRDLRRHYGIKHLAIVSGDHQAPTRKLAEELGMDRYYYNVLPENKAKIVEKMQAQGDIVGFIGDGINDSLAMKKAHVSISLTGASSVATDIAQVVLMKGNLAQLLDLLALSRHLHTNLQKTIGLLVFSATANLGSLFAFNIGLFTSVVLKDGIFLIALANSMSPLTKIGTQSTNPKKMKQSP